MVIEMSEKKKDFLFGETYNSYLFIYSILILCVKNLLLLQKHFFLRF